MNREIWKRLNFKIQIPWNEVAIDLIGPWKIKVRGKVVEFNALTCIDTASNLVELIRIDNKTAAHIKSKFVQSWLSRYPRPIRCVHDRGGEFIGQEFQWLLITFSVKFILICGEHRQVKTYWENISIKFLFNAYLKPDMIDQMKIIDNEIHVKRTIIAQCKVVPDKFSLAWSRDMSRQKTSHLLLIDRQLYAADK